VATADKVGRPGPARSLSREKVLEIALEIMAGKGLDAVSFRSVSKQLGVNPMALYTYIKDKDELLAGMYDTVMSRLEIPADDGRLAAEDQLVAYFSAVRLLLIENADLYRLARPTGVPGADLGMAERVFALFGRLGLAPAAVFETQLTLIQYTVGNALFWASLGTDGLAPLLLSMREALAELDPAIHPHLQTLRELDDVAAPATAFEAAVRSIIRASAADGGGHHEEKDL
jgi:AcrR family transcriptional regulator